MKPIAIYGAGGLGREVLILIQQINEKNNLWNPVGFFDDNLNKGQLVNGLPVLGDINDLNAWQGELNLVLAFGMPAVKKHVFNKINNDCLIFPFLVHPGVHIAPYQNIKIGAGTIIGSGAILTVDIEIGRQVLINLNCTIGHDSRIGDFVSVMPGCNISGEVAIKEGCFVGTGSAILNGCILDENCKIGAGAVVINDIEAYATAIGVPAKQIKITRIKS